MKRMLAIAAIAAVSTVAWADEQPPKLLELVTYSCARQGSVPKYDLKGNGADVILTVTGQVLDSNTEVFDENDTLHVTVVMPSGLKGRIKVTRSTPMRERTEVHILGETAPIKSSTTKSFDCVTETFDLSDFAPGRGEVRIAVLDDKAVPTTVGTYELYVDPLYIGSFSAGPLWTDLVDPEIGVASNGTTNVIVAKADTGHDLRWGAFFTPYVWGKRDVEKTPAWYRSQHLTYPYWHHINPTLGLTFDHVDDNALLGVTIDLPLGILFTYGWHFGKIKELNPDSGLTLGDPFTGPESSLPLRTTTDNDTFIAVTLDMRVFAKLLKSIGGSGAK